MQQAVQHGGNGGAVAKQFAPVVYGPVGGQQGTRTFVAAHDDLQQFLGGGQRQLAHSQVVDDQKRHSGQQVHKLLALAIERGIGQLFQQGVGFAIQHPVALLDNGLSDGLRTVTFPAARRYQNIMPIVRRRSRSTTSGIRYVGRICVCEGVFCCPLGRTSLESFPMEPSAVFQHG